MNDAEILRIARERGAIIGPSFAEKMQAAKESIAVANPKFQQRREGDRFKSDREREYAAVLNDMLSAGRIKSWKYESVKVWLPDWGWYTADFFIEFANGSTEVHEVKGIGKYAVRDKAKAKFLEARRLFTQWKWRCFKRQHDGDWKEILTSS